MSTLILEMELSTGLTDHTGLGDYPQALVLLRLHGVGMGTVRVPCTNGTVRASDVQTAINANPELSEHVAQAVLARWLATPVETPARQLRPTWSIIICTRNRTADLRRCLESLKTLNARDGEIIVVDNAPSDDSTAELVKQYLAQDARVRYVREDRPGLNWARTRGALTATTEIVIYTDDDVVVDPGWVDAMLEPFSHSRVAAVTGLVMPLEMETEAQELFEQYGGFGRGFKRRVFDYTMMAPASSGRVGAGASMAFRRDLLNQMKLFAVELDGGTITRTGGDSYAFYLLLAAGYQIVYTPAALVWHRHRRDYASLKSTLADYSVGGYAVLTRCFVQHGDWQALAVAVGWFYYDHLHQVARVLLRKPTRLPWDLVWAQIVACPRGPLTYFLSRRIEQQRRPSIPSVS